MCLGGLLMGNSGQAMATHTHWRPRFPACHYRQLTVIYPLVIFEPRCMVLFDDSLGAAIHNLPRLFFTTLLPID